MQSRLIGLLFVYNLSSVFSEFFKVGIRVPRTSKAALTDAFLMELFTSIFVFFFVNFKIVSFASYRQQVLDPKTQLRYPKLHLPLEFAFFMV